MSIFHFPFSILHLLGLAAVSLLCGLLLWLQLVAAWPSIEDKIDQFRRQPPFVKLLLMLFVGIFVVFGSTKTNLVDQTSGTNIVEIVEGGTNGIEIAESRPNDVDQVGLQNGEAAAQGGDLSQRGSGVLAACPKWRIPLFYKRRGRRFSFDCYPRRHRPWLAAVGGADEQQCMLHDAGGRDSCDELVGARCLRGREAD